MKKLIKYIVFLPVAALLGGCASEPDPVNSSDSRQTRMLLSVLPSGNTDEEGTVEGSTAENAFNELRLYVATYTTTGARKHSLYSGGVESTNPEAHYYEGVWGPTIFADLTGKGYTATFLAAAFSVPANVLTNFTLGDITDSSVSRTITWPGTSSNHYWTPADDGVNNIPMAGYATITTDYLDGYHRSPDVVMNRAMAKIIIMDPENVVGGVTLKTPDKGYLWPKTTDWLAGTATAPAVPGNMVLQDQTVGKANAVTLQDESGNDVRAYVLYTYEHDFSGLTADDAARGIITLTADPDNNVGATGTTTVNIAPYSGGKPDTSWTVADLNTKNDGIWRGVLRNHIYTFTIHAPEKMGISVSVHIKNWNYPGSIITEL